MQSKVRKELAKAFRQRLLSQLPQFVPAKGVGGRGFDVYTWRSDHGCAGFVALCPHDHWEWVTLEVAWSQDGQFPFSADIFEDPHAPLTPAGKRFRIEGLCRPGLGGLGLWWELAPMPQLEDPESFLRQPLATDLLPRIDGIVADMVEQIRAHVVPYLSRLLTEGCNSLNLAAHGN
jgi:hypothetical protein